MCRRYLRVICYLFILLFIFPVLYTNATLSKKNKKSKDKGKRSEKSVVEEVTGPNEKSVIDLGLIHEKVKAADILKYHASYSKKTNYTKFQGEVLGYVTPWNNHGYDVAKIFGKKFSMVSPVWLQIKRRTSGQFEMEGTHDIDKGWIKDLKRKNNKMLMVPRVLFDGWSVSDFHTLFQSKEKLYQLVDYIVGFLEEFKFDGMALEVWVQYGGHYKAELSGLIKELGEAMISKNLKLILVIPPPLYSRDMQGLFSKDDFDVLSPVVDYFSLMTYDYPHHGTPGPIGPYDWVRQCILTLAPHKNTDRAKILLGLNFYGMHYKSGGVTPIVGRSYLEILKSYDTRIEWLRDEREHRISFRDKQSSHAVFYPTLKSISDRLLLAEELGTGISIWEIGQGLDYFYDLL